jgi:hypothetical protein
MTIKTDKPTLSNLSKRIYQPPRLVTLGKLSSIVTGGSAGNTEGMKMTNQMRRS